MCYLGVSEEDAKTHTHSSDNNIKVICPECGKEKNKRIADIYSHHSIGCSCYDKIPYPEKFTFSILDQIGIDFITQLTKTTFKWCRNKRYDFYFKLNGEDYIIETHGLQHYGEGFSTIKGAKTLDEEIENDRLKKELALDNGIKPKNYIVIDCRYSNSDWIKQNILNSRLSELFNLSNVDWLKAEEFTCSNLTKIACEYKKNNPDMTTSEIGNIMGHSYDTIRAWLKKGVKLQWCLYDVEKELTKRSIKNGRLRKKPVEIFKDGRCMGRFESCTDLERHSKELFGTKLNSHGIATVCRGDRKAHKGFTFKFVKEELNQVI
jgi:ssDNA-binding Zn-finger/Zn-ribbon topoisomerase 1